MKKASYLVTGVLIVMAFSCKGQAGKEAKGSAPVVQPASALQAVQTEGTTHLSKAEFLKLVMDYEKSPEIWKFQGDKPCLVDFYADWCAPCKITSPILEEMAREYSGKINIYKVDIDDEKELANVFGIQSIPTFLFCPMEGNPTLSSGIANTPEATRDMFKQQIERILLKNNTATPL